VARFTLEVFFFDTIRAMELVTILNHCYHHRGFVYHKARFSPDKKSIEVSLRPRQGTAAVCSGCHRPAPGYDHLPERRFDFIPFWGILVSFLYRMRRVHSRTCGVVVEEVPWSEGKHQSTTAHMLFLARGRANFPGKTPPSRSTPLGTRCATQSSTWLVGVWSIARWSRFALSAWMKSSTPKATST
jgi:hypothetical protein